VRCVAVGRSFVDRPGTAGIDGLNKRVAGGLVSNKWKLNPAVS
jgi:hypothetical protein